MATATLGEPDGGSAPEDCRNGGKNSLPVRVGHKVHAVKDDDTYQDGVCVEASEAGCWVRTEDGVLFGTPWKTVMAYASQ